VPVCRGWSNFKPGTRLPEGQDRGCGEFAQLTAVDKGLQDILLGIKVVVTDGGKLFVGDTGGFPPLSSPVVGHVNCCGFRTQAETVPHILLDETLA